MVDNKLAKKTMVVEDDVDVDQIRVDQCRCLVLVSFHYHHQLTNFTSRPYNHLQCSPLRLPSFSNPKTIDIVRV